MQIHELNTFSGTPGSTDFLPIDTGFDTAKISAIALLARSIAYPMQDGKPFFGEGGQILRSNGDGTTEWSDVGLPSDEQTAQAVSDWLDAHPEATTTVADHSLSYEKLINGTLGFVMPEMYGAKGDGVTDDTQAIQDAIDSGLPVVFMPKTYLVTASASGNHIALEIVSPTVLIGNGATLKLAPNSYERYRILRITETNDVYINGLNIVGDKADHSGATGEQGYGFAIAGSNNIHLDNCSASYCWGDGLNIAATYAPLAESVMTSEVYVNNFESHHNRRQGISVEGCDGFYLDNAYIHDIAGTAPQCGIDFEPSPYVDEDTQEQSNFEYIDNVFISNYKSDSIAGEGLYFEDLYATQGGKYILNGCNINKIRISSLSTTINYGSDIQINNIVINQESGRNAFELNIKNPNTNIIGSNIVVHRNGTAGFIALDSVMAGKLHFDGVSLLGGGTNAQLIDITAWNDNAGDGIVIDNLYVPNNCKYTSTANENKAQSGAVVRLAKDIIESSKSGWFYVNNIANVYYFGANISAVAYIQLPYIYDGYEITAINESSYNVELQRENANRPKIYFDNISATKNSIRLAPGSMAKVKFSKKLGAWYLVDSIGTVTAPY